MKDVTKKISKARAILVLEHPFWGSIVLRLKPVPMENIPYIGMTDGDVLIYNPDAIDALPERQVLTLIAHEAAHCLFLHHLRKGSRDHELWNIAGDFVINSILKENGFASIPEWLYDERFNGMCTEKVYALIEKEINRGGGEGENNSIKNDLKNRIIGEVKQAKNETGKPLSDAEQRQMETDWKVIIQQAYQTTKNMGKIPAGLDRHITEIINPKIDYVSVLRKFVIERSRSDYRWSSPNRRYISYGIYLPSLSGEKLGKIAVIIDTSGSISEKELAQVQGEVNDILETYQSDAVVLYCDSEIARIEEFTANDLPIHFNPAGGGGTDMNPAFEKIRKDEIEPACIICFSDGYMPKIDLPPCAPTIFIITDKNSNFDSEYGDVIIMEDM
jgi:predicted metal-dependent peptidase